MHGEHLLVICRRLAMWTGEGEGRKNRGKKQSGRVRGGDQAGEGERKGRKKGRN